MLPARLMALKISLRPRLGWARRPRLPSAERAERVRVGSGGREWAERVRAAGSGPSRFGRPGVGLA